VKTLIVGQNSFIGKHLFHSMKNVDIISYSDIDNINMSEYNTILNCAISPEMKFDDYREHRDIDYKVACKARLHNCHFIMLSTRKVYGNSTELKTYNEESELNPFDKYSENKLRSEQNILKVNPTSTILRGSNVIGFEYDRKSFMGYCMTQLKNNNEILYEMDPDLKRDFIDIDNVCKTLKKVIEVKPQGIYNLSSNIGFSIGDVSKLLIKGYGSGKMVVDITKQGEQFILDNTKLEAALNTSIGPFDFDNIIFEIGKKL
jgi:nucleoside-diphosphate-sugar epimerase